MPLASLGENLSTRLGKREKAVKECLLNQSVITGNGNIYSDKILFATHIHPERPANTSGISKIAPPKQRMKAASELENEMVLTKRTPSGKV